VSDLVGARELAAVLGGRDPLPGHPGGVDQLDVGDPGFDPGGLESRAEAVRVVQPAFKLTVALAA
jgi:hypothetical protein